MDSSARRQRSQQQMLTALGLLVSGRLQEVAPAAVPGTPYAPPPYWCPPRPMAWSSGSTSAHPTSRQLSRGGRGRLLASQRQEADVDREALGALDAAGRMVAVLLTRLGLDRSAVWGAAVGLPGPVDLGALGELRFGAARGHADVLYVKASHGVGAGLVLGSRSYRGATGLAGEIGRTQVPGAAEWCRCGNRGCLETVVSVGQVRRQLGLARPGSAGLLTGTPQDPVSTRILRERAARSARSSPGSAMPSTPGSSCSEASSGPAASPWCPGCGTRSPDTPSRRAVPRRVTTSPTWSSSSPPCRSGNVPQRRRPDPCASVDCLGPSALLRPAP